MKKTLLILLIIAGLIGCRYKEGPALNFHSVKKRMEGTWQVTGFTSDGVDSLQYYNDSCGCKMTIHFSSDENKIHFDECPPQKITKGGGDFYFADNRKKIKVFLKGSPFKGLGPLIGNGSNIGSDCLWKILRLSMTDFKISTNLKGRNYIITFKK